MCKIIKCPACDGDGGWVLGNWTYNFEICDLCAGSGSIGIITYFKTKLYNRRLDRFYKNKWKEDIANDTTGKDI